MWIPPVYADGAPRPRGQSSTTARMGGIYADGAPRPCGRLVSAQTELYIRADRFYHLRVKLRPCGCRALSVGKNKPDGVRAWNTEIWTWDADIRPIHFTSRHHF
jgi:hypothetical protein